MTTKLPQGVAVWIDVLGQVFRDGEFIFLSKPNGLALTHDQLDERDKTIARAAYLRGRSLLVNDGHIETLDDYLQSEEFKKLIGDTSGK